MKLRKYTADVDLLLLSLNQEIRNLKYNCYKANSSKSGKRG